MHTSMIKRALESAPIPTIPATSQARDRIVGRIVEAKGTDSSGGRVFRVRLIAYGDSKNGRRYPESVMREAVHLYEGAKAFDHHRSESEMASGTIAGMVGSFRSVEAATDGLYADLHLLPSATHAAEAMDASLAATGGTPLIGVSHDVLAAFRPVTEGVTQLQEATQIVRVNSADLVSDPAAGGLISRAVAGGIEGTGTGTEPTSPSAPEIVHDARTARGRLVITQECTARGLAAGAADGVAAALPEQFTEAQLTSVINAVHTATAARERTGLAPTIQITQETRDKKLAALDAMLSTSAVRPAGPAYRSLREAWSDITGARVNFLEEDTTRRIMRDTMGAGYDSAMSATESLDAGSWAQVLGDSITRRLIAEYSRANLQSWRQIVSSMQFGLDFRTQRRARIGGYGILPAVGSGAPYQPLTSPPDEEATYSVTKRGGTEDITLEMIANDDIQAIRSIPLRLGRSAAITLYRFIWDMLPANAATSYDGTALFHANHANTDNPALLSTSALSTGRRKMRKQTAYGDSTDLLSFVPRFIVVPSDLEELAWQLCTSAVALPAGAPVGAASDIPNIHQGITPLVIDYYSDVNDWFLIADPSMCPTIELGFNSTSELPELFTQSDPTVGSHFNSDVITFKIRHMYSGAVLDHRAFYRGNN